MKTSAIGCVLGIFLCLGGFWAAPLWATYGGGGGWTADDPFLISEPAHLLAIGSHPEHWDKFFRLTANIDLSDSPWTAAHFIGINMGIDNYFSGTFDGNGHTISNLSYTAAGGNYVGLFGYIVSGTVRNLTLEDVTLDLGVCNYVGGLVGVVADSGRIENCHVSYAITVGDSRQFIGGLAGMAVASIISNSSSDGTMTVGKGSMQVGGLVGWNSANIVNCHSTGTIVTVGVGTSSLKIGGLVGEHEGQYGPIDGCWSACTITPGGQAYAIGGLVGQHKLGNITNCFTTGAVQGTYNVGGLVGTSTIAEDSYGTISGCFSTSDVIGSRLLGGLAGTCEYTVIEDCRSSGTVRGADSAQQVGGLVGQLLYFGSRISNCSSTADVIAGANAWSIGGLCGSSSNALIETSYSDGTVVTGGGDTRFVGGLAGTSGTAGMVRNCYSLSSVDGGATGRWVGGLVGRTYSQEIKHCFAAGAVQNGGDYTGGLIGENFEGSSIVTGCVWDKEASGIDHSDGGKGYLTNVMQQQSTFTSMSWDFADTWKLYDYPGLAWQPEIGIRGDLSVSVGEGEQATLDLDVFCLRNATLQWSVTGDETCGWIAAVTPQNGVSTGPDDVTTVAITIDTSGLGLGTYVHELSLVGDNGETLPLTLTLEVFSRIKLDTFAELSQYWGTRGCDFGQPCKAVDWYVDGAIDWRDLNLLAEAWLGQEIATVKATLQEGFESGDFSGLNWQHGGDAPWTITSDSYEGGWAVKSGVIGNTEQSVLEVTLDLTGWQADTIWFAWKTSSESGFDLLRFYIDDVEKLSESGVDSGYRTYVYPGGIRFTPGVRTFKWVYSKDAGDAVGEDCAWIDDIRIYAQ